MNRFSLIIKIMAVFMSVILVLQIIPTSLLVVSAETLQEQTEFEGYSTSVSQNAEEPIILGEDIELRNNSNIKHFKMSDGTTKMTVYNEPVHYMDENGSWQDIDNTLVVSNSDNSDELLEYDGYETQKNRFKVKFAKNSNQKKLVSIKTEKYLMSFSLVAESKEGKSVFSSSAKIEEKKKSNDATVLQNIKEKVLYENILNDTDIEYTVSGESVKENIIVKSQQNEYEYTFDVDVKNLELSLTDDGSINAVDTDTKDIVFTMPKPFMIDSNGEFSTDVNYTINTHNKKKYQIIITADKEWINHSERVLPVTIDPGVQTEQSKSAIDSVYVSSGKPSENLYSDPMIMVGKDSSGLKRCHGLIKFDLPTLKRGDVVIDAKLSALQVNASAYSNTTPDTALEVRAVLESWNKKTVTWNNKPSFDGEAVDIEILKASEAGNTSIQRDWNVTSIVKKWYEDPYFENNGFLLRSSNELASTLNDSCIYAWLYGEKYSQSAGYPILTITYRSNKGLESYWSYTTLSAGRAGTASICDFSGNLVFTHFDAATAGNRSPVTVSHVFNNFMATESFQTYMHYRGHGWMLNYQQQLLPSSRFGLTSDAQEKYPFVYIDGDGTEHYFLKKSNGTMIDEDGMGLTLTIPGTSPDFFYKIADDNGNSMWFNTSGSLAKTVDNNGNQISNYYTSVQTNKIISVGDGAGRYIDITPTYDNLAVGAVTDAAGRTTTFTWSYGSLITITYSDGKTTTFTYDSDGAMTSAKSPDGYELQFSYTPLKNGKRVSKVVEKTPGATGQTITFDYSQYGKTVLRSSGKDGVYGNSDDVITTTSFDSAGRTVSSEATSNGKSLAATSAEYTAAKANSDASNIKQLNKLSRSITGGTFVRNYLQDGSADSTGYWEKAEWNGTASYIAVETTSDQLYGQKAFLINSKSINSGAGARAYQTLSSSQFEAGKTYTFSAWVKTQNIVPLSSNNYGAELMLTYWLSDGTIKDTHSESIIGTTDTSINNGWQRISLTVAVPSTAIQLRCNIMLRDSTGIARFDGMQLEVGSCASPFNLINNASFEAYELQESTGSYWPANWSGYLTSTGDSVDNAYSRDSSHAFRFRAVPTTAKEMYQDINLYGNSAEKLDDTYIISGWVYANPIGGNDENNRISLCAKVVYDDGTYCHHWFDFNSSVEGWQYIMGAFTLRDKSNPSAVKTASKIRIHLINYRQSNKSWFDDIQLIRDEAPSYTYDSNGNLVSVLANAEQNSSMEYSNNNLTKYTDAKGYQYSYTYDTKHNMTQATSQGGTKFCYQYDSNGNPTSLSIKKTGTLSIETGASYTSNGAFVSSTSDQDGYSEYYTYNDAKGTLTSYTDKKGNVLNYTYDANTDAITSVSQTLSNGQTVRSNYTYEDYRLKTISHNGFNYSFIYDSFGNVTQTKVGSQALATNTYGSYNGDLKRVTYGNGDYVDYTYDDYGNVAAISQNGSQNFTWYYDSTGNLYSHNDLVNNQKYLYTYDSTGRLVRQSVVNPSNNKNIYDAEYGYDLNNNVSRFTSLAGGTSLTEKFSYGTDNLPSVYTYPNGKTATYSHDVLLRRNKILINTTNPIEHRFVYWMSDRCVNDSDDYRTTKIGWEYVNDDIYKCEYDVNGNIVNTLRMNQVSDSEYSRYQHYVYDELNRLIRADDLEKNCTEVYNYNNGGNITSVVTYPHTWGSLSGLTPTKTVYYTYGDSNWKDKLTSYNGQSITYDAIGNPLSYRGYTLDWQNGRQLASLSGNGKTVTYTYDVDGLRTSKTVNGVKHEYYYVGSRLQYEKFGSSKLWFFYDADGNPSGVRYYNGSSTADYYFVCNWRGDVIRIFDSTGADVAEYFYDAWGNVVSVRSPSGAEITSSTHIANVNPLRYRGYYYDNETKLYYVNSRYYDPEVKRMLNADDSALAAVSLDTLTDKNYFAYCDNNPVSRTDGEGNIWHIVAGAAVGAVLNSIDGVIEVVSAYKNAGDTTKAWLSLGVSFVSGAISGGLSMSGVCATTSLIVNVTTSVIGEGINQIIYEDFSLANLAVAGIEGVISGASRGSGTSKATKAGVDTIKRTFNTAVRVKAKQGTQAAAKAYKGRCIQQASKYFKQTKHITKNFFANLAKDVVSTAIKTAWNVYNKFFKKVGG